MDGIRNTEGFPIDPDSDYGSWIFPIYGNQKSEVFPIDRNCIMGVGWMSEVTKGQVDNENNSQS